MDFINCFKSFSCLSQMELLLCLQTADFSDAVNDMFLQTSQCLVSDTLGGEN